MQGGVTDLSCMLGFVDRVFRDEVGLGRIVGAARADAVYGVARRS